MNSDRSIEDIVWAAGETVPKDGTPPSERLKRAANRKDRRRNGQVKSKGVGKGKRLRAQALNSVPKHEIKQALMPKEQQ